MLIYDNGRTIESIPPGEIDYNLLKTEIYFKRDEKIDQSINQYKDKCVLVVGLSTRPGVSITKLLCLKSLNLKKLVGMNSVRPWCEEYFDDIIFVDIEDLSKKEETLDKVKKYEKDNNIAFDAIFFFDDFPICMATYLCEKMNLQEGIPFDYALRMRNKYEFREECKRLGIPYTRSFLIKDNERLNYAKNIRSLAKMNEKDEKSIVEELFGLRLPCVIKLTTGSAKDFVRMCKTTMDLVENLESSIHEIKENNSCPAELILEEFYDGHEINFELLVKNNKLLFLAISDNYPQYPPYFLESGNQMPSYYLDKNEISYLRKEVSNWISKMNYNNAILNIDAKCRPKSLYGNSAYFDNDEINAEIFVMPIEINMRIGGRDIQTIVEECYGVDLVKEYLNICLNFPVDENKLVQAMDEPLHRCITQYYVAYNCSGIVNSVHIDLKSLIEKPEVFEIGIMGYPEDTSKPFLNVGWVMTKVDLDENIEKVECLLADVLNCVKYR